MRVGRRKRGSWKGDERGRSRSEIDSTVCGLSKTLSHIWHGAVWVKLWRVIVKGCCYNLCC